MFEEVNQVGQRDLEGSGHGWAPSRHLEALGGSRREMEVPNFYLKIALAAA